MVGMLRAWNVSAEVGEVRAVCEAVVRDWRREDWEGVGEWSGVWWMWEDKEEE
jgi:hypothetical protein